MTKEELDRIKKAYSSGLKVQIWFDGHWEYFDAREYSMYTDPFSENRLYRIVGSDYADIAEKQIAELKTRVENQKSFLERIRAKFNLGEIERKEIEGYLESDQLTKAKEIIENLLGVLPDEVLYHDYYKRKYVDPAEQFLNSEVEK